MSHLTGNGVPVFEKPSYNVDIMGIDYLDDYEMRMKRQDAFWSGAVIDRPVVHMTLPSLTPGSPMPEKKFATIRERWHDVEFVVDKALSNISNTRYLGDALPMVFPNLGPEVFSAYFGTEMEYSETTSWAIPNLEEWSDIENIKFSANNFYWKKTIEMTDALLEAGKGKFYTGYTDLHPGADALAGFRDPLNLNFDLIDNVDAVKSLLKYTDDVFEDVFNFWCDKLQSAGQAIGTWAGIATPKRSHVPSDDFSCMISNEMFNDIFLPGITRECDAAEASIYHLDGPDALRHLDSLLDISSLNAIQWIWGAGNGRASDWLEVFQRCQSAEKGLQITCAMDELDVMIENLKPEGVWLRLAIENEDDANLALKKISKWL